MKIIYVHGITLKVENEIKKILFESKKKKIWCWIIW